LNEYSRFLRRNAVNREKEFYIKPNAFDVRKIGVAQRPEVSIYNTGALDSEAIWKIAENEGLIKHRYSFGRATLTDSQIAQTVIELDPFPNAAAEHVNMINWPDEADLLETQLKLARLATLFLHPN